MEIMSRLELFSNLGYKSDPFKTAKFETGDALRVRRIVAMAIESRAMVTIVGPRGIGKTEAIEDALKHKGATIITLEKSEKTKITSGDIEMAMVLDLSSESPLGGEKLGRQVRPILGAAALNERKKVVLVIEEAQRLNVATLKSLKTLREKKWMGEAELFTVILISQSDPMARPGLSEVRLRIDCVHLQGLTSAEAAGYVRGTVGRHFEEDAIEAVSTLPAARNFLELQELCVMLLNLALMSGRERVALEDVKAISDEDRVALPRGNSKKAQPAVKSPKDALRSVLEKRAGEPAPAAREAINA